MPRLLIPIADYLRGLDSRSRAGQARDVVRDERVSAEQLARRAELQFEVDVFLSGLPAWLLAPHRFTDPSAASSALGICAEDPPGDPSTAPGLVWLAATDLKLARLPAEAAEYQQAVDQPSPAEPPRSPKGWLVKGLAGRSSRAVLARDTRLHLLGRAARGWTTAGAGTETLPPPEHLTEERGLVFRILDGPRCGDRLRLPAVAGRPWGAALLAGTMIAPVGHRVADWPSAAAEVLQRNRDRLAIAEAAMRTLSLQEGWGWQQHFGDGATHPASARVPVERNEDDRR